MPRADPPVLAQGLLATTSVEQSVEVQAVQSGPSSGEVQGWLAAHALEKYASSLAAQGYDKLLFLRGLGEAEVEGLVQSLQMPTPHARAFRAALEALVPAATVTAGGAPILGVQTATAVPARCAPQPTVAIAQQAAQPAQIIVQESNRNRNLVSTAIFAATLVEFVVVHQKLIRVGCYSCNMQHATGRRMWRHIRLHSYLGGRVQQHR
jgi:hypothetical protein